MNPLQASRPKKLISGSLEGREFQGSLFPVAGTGGWVRAAGRGARQDM